MRTVQPSKSSVLLIDRSQPFDHGNFLGGNWRFSKTVDERALDLRSVTFPDSFLIGRVVEDHEGPISGYIRMERLRSIDEYVLPDASIFNKVWERKIFRKPTNLGWPGRVSLDGTVLTAMDGTECIPFFFWRNGELKWGVRSLEQEWPADYVSLLYAPMRTI